MAWMFRGNISGSIYSIQQDLPMNVNSFLLVNKTGSTIGVNVYMFEATTNQKICMMPSNKQINTGESYESVRQVVMLPTEVIEVQSTGSMDYDFYIDNMTIT